MIKSERILFILVYLVSTLVVPLMGEDAAFESCLHARPVMCQTSAERCQSSDEFKLKQKRELTCGCDAAPLQTSRQYISLDVPVPVSLHVNLLKFSHALKNMPLVSFQPLQSIFHPPEYA